MQVRSELQRHFQDRRTVLRYRLFTATRPAEPLAGCDERLSALDTARKWAVRPRRSQRHWRCSSDRRRLWELSSWDSADTIMHPLRDRPKNLGLRERPRAL